MSSTVDTTVTCWKQHRCQGCRAVYRYLFTRRVRCRDRRPELARERAKALVAERIQSECDQVACPGCGWIQPEMLGWRRELGHRSVTRLGLRLLLGVLLLHALADWLTRRGVWVWQPRLLELTWLCSGLAAATVLAQALIGLRSPNLLRWLHRWQARRAVRTGRVAVLQRGTNFKRPRLASRGPLGGLLVCLLAWLALSGSLLLAGLLGWPLNPELDPPVLGPGDQARLQLGTLRSVRGGWRGQVQSQWSAQEVGLSTLTEIGSLRWSRPSWWTPVWVDLSLGPDAPAVLSGEVRLVATYPLQAPGGGIAWNSRTFERPQLEVRTARAYAGRLYLWVGWRLGLLLGLLLLSLGGQLLAFAARDDARQGYPVSLLALDAVPSSLEDRFKDALQRL